MKHKTLWLGLVAGIVLAVLWLYYSHPAALLERIITLHPGPLLAAAVVYLVAYTVRAMRWRILLKPTAKVTRRDAFFWWMAGNFLNYIVPVRAGEFLRGWFVKKKHGSPVSAVLPSVFLDKLFDFVAIVVVFILLPFLPLKVGPVLWCLIAALSLIFLCGMALLVLSGINQELVERLFRRVFFFVGEKWERQLHRVISLFVGGMGMYKNHRGLLWQCGGYSLVAAGLDSLFFYLLFIAFGAHPPYLEVLFGYSLIFLSYALPIHPPAQVGSNEWLMLLIFGYGFGMDIQLVNAVMPIGHLLSGLILIVAGFWGLSWAGIGLFSALNLNKYALKE